MSSALRLSDILVRTVSVEWFEAVAVVTEVARLSLEAQEGGVPELDQVQLHPDGTITLTGVTETDEPVRRVGQMLQALLAQADPPVQLRLEVEQATGPEPAFASVEDYVEALAYFERPDRSSVLRTLYSRAHFAPGSSTERTPTLDTIAPLPRREPKTGPHQEASATRPVWKYVVVATAAMVVLALAATAYSNFRADRPDAPDVAGFALQASDAVGATVVKGISAVSERVGLGRLVPADSPAGVAPTPPPGSVKTTGVEPRQRRVDAPLTPETLRLFDLEQQPNPPLPGVVTVELKDSPSSSAPSAAPTDDDERIYSASDTTVAAPVGVRPQLPRVVPSDVQSDQLGQIELIIRPDGSVSSVKLLGGRRGVLEGMLLSAAKSWTFLPAVKDGKPVAYRKIVWLALY